MSNFSIPTTGVAAAREAHGRYMRHFTRCLHCVDGHLCPLGADLADDADDLGKVATMAAERARRLAAREGRTP